MTGPLSGVRVVELAGIGPAPFAVMLLADMGASVVRVDRAGPASGDYAPNPVMERGRRSIAVNLKDPAGADVVRRLVARADVFVQSLRAGVVGELGVDFAGATALNPRIVYCNITAFGTRGPLADRPGYDPLMQAYGGLMSINGHPGAEPARVGTSPDARYPIAWYATHISAVSNSAVVTSTARPVASR